MGNFVSLPIAGLVMAAATCAALAQSAPTEVATSGSWTTYSIAEKGAKHCYVVSQPTESLPKGVNRDPVYFLVTTRPGEGIKNEASVIIGYPLKEGSKVTVTVGSQDFTMFSKDDGAWLEQAADEDRLVAAMRKGASMTVKGTSRRGTNTTDTFSLSGISTSLDKMIEACK